MRINVQCGVCANARVCVCVCVCFSFWVSRLTYHCMCAYESYEGCVASQNMSK